MSINEHNIFLKPKYCDLLLYDEKENVFYECFANFDLSEDINKQKTNEVIFFVIFAICIIISLISLDFFTTLNETINNIIFILCIILGCLLGVLTSSKLTIAKNKNIDAILKDSSITKLDSAGIDKYVRYFKKDILNCIIAKLMLCVYLITFIIILSHWQAFFNFPFIIHAFQSILPLLLVDAIKKASIWYKRMKEYQTLLDK